MSNTTYATSLRLKTCGLPQPQPSPGQHWYGKKNAGFECEAGSLCLLIGTDTGNLQFTPVDGKENGNNKFFVFAPDLDYITAFLPEGWKIEMWDGRFSCKVETSETEIRTQGETTAEVAALAYIALNEK